MIKPIMRKNGRMMFDIEATFIIGLEELAYAVYNQMHIFDKLLPLSRKECIELLKKDLSQGNTMRDDWADELDLDKFERVKIVIARLFPELEAV